MSNLVKGETSVKKAQEKLSTPVRLIVRTVMVGGGATVRATPVHPLNVGLEQECLNLPPPPPLLGQSRSSGRPTAGQDAHSDGDSSSAP